MNLIRKKQMKRSVLVISAVFFSSIVGASEHTLSEPETLPKAFEQSLYQPLNDNVLLALRGGVITRTFNGQGRCSEITPILQDICRAKGGSPGRVWCDESRHPIVVGNIVCN